MDFYTRGIEKFRKGDIHGAIQDLTQAIKMNPNFAPAYSVCGGAYFALGDYQGAIACHDQAIRLNPKLAESYGDRALARYELGDKQGAIVDFTQSIQLNPNLAYSFYGRGVTCLELGEISGIFADFQKAATLFLQQEDIRGREQRLHEIQQYYRNGIGFLHSNAKDAMEQGIKEGKENNPDRAIHNFVRAIQLDPNLADAYFWRGTVYLELGSNREAIEDFTQAIALNPTWADAYHNRGCIYFDLGNSQEAIADFTQSIKLDPYSAKAYCNRSSSYLSQRNHYQQAAITDLQRAAELFEQQGDKPSYEWAIRQIQKLG